VKFPCFFQYPSTQFNTQRRALEAVATVTAADVVVASSTDLEEQQTEYSSENRKNSGGAEESARSSFANNISIVSTSANSSASMGADQGPNARLLSGGGGAQ